MELHEIMMRLVVGILVLGTLGLIGYALQSYHIKSNPEQYELNKALEWWWQRLDGNHRRILNRKYSAGINDIPESGCDQMILQVYQNEIAEFGQSNFDNRYSAKLIKYRTTGKF